MKKLLIIFIIILSGCGGANNENKISLTEHQRSEDIKTCEYYGFKKDTAQFSICLMQIDIARKENIRTRKMLECEAVRRDNTNSGVTGFWGGVLMGARENLACDKWKNF